MDLIPNVTLTQHERVEWSSDEQKTIQLLTTIVVLKRRAEERDLDANDYVDAIESVLALANHAERVLDNMGIEVVDPGR